MVGAFLKRFLVRENDVRSKVTQEMTAEKKAHNMAVYRKERHLAEYGSPWQRRRLARRSSTHPEILYYLAAHDKDRKVRQALLQNEALPLQATTVMAYDGNEDIRLVLVKRLVALLPGLSGEAYSRLYAHVVQSLGILAQDEVLRVRKALSSALQYDSYAPPAVAGILAKDLEREISEPILRFCAAVRDEDLLEILKGYPEDWAVEAIASREKVSTKVSRAVIGTGQKKAGRMLIENEEADINEELCLEIIARAYEVPEWQEPLARRKKLSERAAKALIEFSDAKVRDILVAREDFDKETIEEISEIFRRRLQFVAGEETVVSEKPAEKALRLYKEGRLDESALTDSLAMMDKDFLYVAMACLARFDTAAVRKIFDLNAARPVIALCWQAGLSMRFALQLQKDVMRLPPKELVYPRGGTDFPFSAEEMASCLELVGITLD